MRNILHTLALSMIGMTVWAQSAPGFDSSGNGLLNGNYNFHQVVYGNFDNSGAMGRLIALYGTINFDGKGNYSVTGQLRDSTATAARAYTTTGTYSAAPSGLAKLESPLFEDESVYGLVSRGVFVGSSTEGGTNDLFVAIAVTAQPAAAAALQGSYWLSSIDFPSGDPRQTRDALFKVTANGQGGIAASTATGYIGTSATAVSQSIAGFNYTLANGAGTLSFPAATGNQVLISGDKAFYVSGDGNFFLGGSTTGYDFVVGMRSAAAGASNALLSGTYYTAGLNQDNTDFPDYSSYFDTFYGSLSAGSGKFIQHDRVAPFDDDAYDYGFDSAYSIQPDGAFNRPSFRYGVAVSGLGFIGIGKAPTAGLIIAVKSPEFSGTGPYISPVGIVNAASNAPFTAGVARGELVTLYGSSLAGSTAVASAPFPTILSGVQVTVNGRPAPVYSVSPTQVSVVVPYATEISYAQFQLKYDGATSNAVTEFVNDTSPGVFSVPPGGLGAAAALHADYSLVSAVKPAQKGETILVFLTGLGDVAPAVPEGSAAPSNPLSKVTSDIAVYIDGVKSTVSFAGLAPGLPGLYQINVVVPKDSSSGDVYLEIDGPDAATAQVKIAVQ